MPSSETPTDLLVNGKCCDSPRLRAKSWKKREVFLQRITKTVIMCYIYNNIQGWSDLMTLASSFSSLVSKENTLRMALHLHPSMLRDRQDASTQP